jgi:hypothetical protein
MMRLPRRDESEGDSVGRVTGREKMSVWWKKARDSECVQK